MAFDLAKFLAEDLKLSGDELASVQTVLSADPTRIAAIEKSLLRQSDFSRQSDALRKKEKELADADARLNAEIAAVAEMEAAGKDLTAKQKKDLDDARLRVFKLESAITELATAQGVDPKTILGDQPVTQPPAAPVVPPVDTSKFVGADAFSTMSQYMFNLTTELPLLIAEHQELTGQRLDTRALRDEILKRAGTKGANTDPRTVWEELHNIPQVRQTKADEKRTADLKAARDEGYAAAQSELALPTGSPSHHVARQGARPSPILHRVDEKGQPVRPIAAREQPQSRLMAAASALRAGTYSNAGPGGRMPATKSA